MPVRCQDCNSHFLLDGTTVAQGIGCPDCGGTKLERDQPSPTRSDGDLRDMVDPATQLDQGGNPLQEGVWAGVDGGWQPGYRRDETFSKIAMMPPPSGIEPQHHQVVTPGEAGLHNGNLFWLGFLDASVNGKSVRENMNQLFDEHAFRDHPNFRQPVTISVHHPEHMPAAIEAAQSGTLRGTKASLQVDAPIMAATGQAIMQGRMPAPPGITPRPQPQAPPVMSNSYSRSLSQDPYLPWYHQADVVRYPAGGGDPTTLTTEEWAADKKRRYQERQLSRGGHRLNWQPGQAGRGIMIGSQLHTWPVEKTLDNPRGGDMHGEYVQKLGVNPANVDVRTGFEINPDGTMVGANVPPEAGQIDPNLRPTEEGFDQMFGHTKEALGPLMAPLLAIGGRALLGAALGGLMRKAIGGQGNYQQQPQPYPGDRPVGLVASERVGVGHNAPVETPGSVPDMVEDHDPEAVDQKEFNDESDSSSLKNPLIDGQAGGSQNPDGGEDQTVQKLEFRHDGDGVTQAEMLLPLIMEYINSDKSALENPQLKALHDQLESEIPDYLNLAGEDDEAVHKLLESLKNPQVESRTAAPVYMTTPMAPGQQQMGMGQQQQMAMPGTHQNPVQPGGMPVQGKCQNCGGTLNADGSCPQCGAAAGVNQQGNLEGQGNPNQLHQPVGIMPGMYAHTAADHQGPITPQQKEVFAEYLIQQGRNEEVATMMGNPGMYADEWAQYLNRSTQPPEVDPAEQAPQPQMDPSQMGQMPMPGMSVPPQAGPVASTKTADSARRCPKCQSATTTLMNPDGDMRCHRCQNVWKSDVVKEKISFNWVVKSYQDALNDGPNPVAAPAADATAPGDREQQQDSSLTWQSTDGTPLQVGQTYEMHNPNYAIPDVVKVQAVKPDSITVTMEGEYNAPSDPEDQNGPDYPHEIDRQELETQGLTFNPLQNGEGEQEQSQDQNDQDGIGQTVNTEPTRQSPEFPNTAHTVVGISGGMTDQDPQGRFGVGDQVNYIAYGGRTEQGTIVGFQTNYAQDPFVQNRFGEVKVVSRNDIQPDQPQAVPAPEPQMAMAKTLPTDHCPKCEYGHVTSSYESAETVRYECYRCAHAWQVTESDEDSALGEDSRAWLNESSIQDDIGFDPRALAMASSGQGRNIGDIAKKDPRLAEIRERLNANKTAGAKFSPREQRAFIDEDGVARNADRLNLDGTHYESAFDNSKARPDRVNDNYLGLGL